MPYTLFKLRAKLFDLLFYSYYVCVAIKLTIDFGILRCTFATALIILALSCRGLVVMSCDSHLREVVGSNPDKSHWWMTGRASGPKMLTAPAKSQLTIGHRPSPVKTRSV